MGEENPSANSLGKEEHIYLDVIHIASRPPSKRSLCPTAARDESLQKPTVENVATKKTSKKSGLTNCVLVATIILLSAVCCALCALYVIERRHSAMLESEKNQANGFTSPTPSVNCTRVDSVAPAEESQDCTVMESELKRRKAAYNKKCPSTETSGVETSTDRNLQSGINKTPKSCINESLQFQSILDKVTSRSTKTMRSATVCFWTKAAPGVLHYVKYTEPNNGAHFEIVEEKSSTQSTIDTNWHSFCWMLSTGEEFQKFYKDGNLLSYKEINREIGMRSGGTWELGLRMAMPGGQTVGGEVNPKQYGEITSVNAWDRILRMKERNEVMASCLSNYQGNVKSWQELKSAVQGNVKLVKSTCCKT